MFYKKIKSFLDLNIWEINNAVVLLDVDGCIVRDGAIQIDNQNLQKLKDLSQVSTIYLCSNGSYGRTENIAKLAQVFAVKSNYRKPNKNFVSNINFEGKKVFVVGDKYLTDGLFAKNLGAEFIKINHFKSKEDSLLTKLIYFIDDLFGKLFLW